MDTQENKARTLEFKRGTDMFSIKCKYTQDVPLIERIHTLVQKLLRNATVEYIESLKVGLLKHISKILTF